MSKIKPNQIGKRLERALAPVAIGFLLDVVDFFSLGPEGMIFGFIAGWGLGFYLARSMRLPEAWHNQVALAAGVYCLIPGMRFIPLGTIVGVCSRFFAPLNDEKSSNTNKR